MSPPARHPRRARWYALAGLAVVAVAILIAVVLRGHHPGPARIGRGPRERHSAWVLPAALSVATEPSATLEPAPDAGTAAALVVRAEDVTGGPIAGAVVRIDDEVEPPSEAQSEPLSDPPPQRTLGTTDATGVLAVGTAGLASIVRVAGAAPGYEAASALARVPGEVVLRLLPASRVAGRVIERGSGRPVPGLRVRCEEQETQSAQDGGFLLTGVTPGRHRIEARGEGWIGTLAQPFSLGPADDVRDLVVTVDRGFTLGGRVLADGHGVGGVNVDLLAPDREDLSVRTDADGRYRQVGLRPGRYGFRITGDGLMATIVDEKVSIVDHDVDFDIDLGHRERLAFEVVDRAGRPLPKIRVHVAEEHEGMRSAPSCRTDAAGVCAIRGLWPGEASYSTDTGQEHPLTVPVVGPVRIVLDGVGQLRGRVVRRDGQPVGSRFVEAYGPDEAHASVTTNERGGFQLVQLPAGLYQIEVYLRNGICAHTPREAAAEVQIASGTTAELTLQVPFASAPIAGVVQDEAGRPVADALVTYDVFDPHLLHESNFERGADLVASDARGAFVLAGALEHYHYTLTATTRDGRLAVLDDVPAGSKTAVLRLERLADLTVEVAGWNAPEVAIEVRRAGETEQYRSVDGEAGSCHIDSLRPGPVIVSARGARGQHVESPLTLQPGRTATVRLSPPAESR